MQLIKDAAVVTNFTLNTLKEKLSRFLHIKGQLKGYG